MTAATFHPLEILWKMTQCGLRLVNIYHGGQESLVKVCDNQLFNVQVDYKTYHNNMHHLTRRYPRVPISEDDGPMPKESPQRILRSRPKVKMPQIPVQATMQKDFIYL